MGTTRRIPRSLSGQRHNPIRELIAEKQRAAEIRKSRDRAGQLSADLPSIIQDHVGEHMEKLENKLIHDFKEMGQKAIEESTAVLGEQLNGRIETLEKISSLQSKTIMTLRDSSRAAEEKVGAVVDSIEKSLSGVVSGFKLEPSAYRPLPAAPPIHPSFLIPESQTEVVKADPQELAEALGRNGFCPNCTSTNVRRANRTGLFEEFLRLFFVAPFRCRACRHKFYRF